MSFVVNGYINGVAYQVVVDGAPGGNPDLRAGCAAGDPGVIAALNAGAGEPWLATPTGPAGLLDLTSPASVFGFLCDRTDVTSTTGDVPDLTGPPVPGAVY
jgi:hypothetical protein